MSKRTKASNKLAVAQRHLARVQDAWPEPTDWDDLLLYGFYCLEAAVEAAALHVGMPTSHNHWEKVKVATRLHEEKGLPDIAELLVDLNTARKAAAYGDIDEPELDAESVATDVENYVHAVVALFSGKK